MVTIDNLRLVLRVSPRLRLGSVHGGGEATIRKGTKRRGAMRQVVFGAVSMLTVFGVTATVATGKPEYMKAAKDQGLPAQNCQYCHTVAVPKKETFKPQDLNERGKFLVEEMKKRNATVADPALLKGYPAAKEQK